MSNCNDQNGDDPIGDAIDRLASSGVRSSSEGDRQRENYNLSDLIEADRYRRGNRAANTPGRGLYFTKLIPPGTG